MPRVANAIGQYLAVAFAAVVVGPAEADPPTTTQPAQPAPLRSVEERVEALRATVGPGVEITPPPDGGTMASVRGRFSFDDPGELRCFAVVGGRWDVGDGLLRGSGVGVSQIVCLLPMASESCAVRVRGRSNRILELSLLDPLAERFDGTRAVGRLHFGRMDYLARTDWLELSSGQHSLQKVHAFRFPDQSQEATLTLADGSLSATLTVEGGVKAATGRVPDANRPAVVHVSLAGGVNNAVQLDTLEIDGRIDLASDHTTVLTGMGHQFWSGGRDVDIYYRARGHFRRLLLNGQVVAEQAPIEGVWWPYVGPVHQTTLRLNHGDVLAFDLAGVDDEGALHVVGVDQTTDQVVLASHPLTFVTIDSKPTNDWYVGDAPGPTERPRLSQAQDASVLRQFRQLLGRNFPGLPVIGPAVSDNREVYLKTLVR